MSNPYRQRVHEALDIIMEYGSIDGAHHKAWVLDQVVRALTGCPTVTKRAISSMGKSYEYEARGESEEYLAWVARYKDGEDGPETYEYDVGIIP